MVRTLRQLLWVSAMSSGAKLLSGRCLDAAGRPELIHYAGVEGHGAGRGCAAAPVCLARAEHARRHGHPRQPVHGTNLSHTCALHGYDSTVVSRSPEKKVLRYLFSS